jgi:sugar O-acyltransferase (sialic acid O-acetyltransferase NeuD family)
MIYLFGASGHGLVILDMLRLQQQHVAAFVDDADKPAMYGEIPVIKTADFCLEANDKMIVSVGNTNARQHVVARYAEASFATALHPSAVVACSVAIGEGTVVMAGAIINAYAAVGKHCIINTGASVDHECVLGDFVHIAPHATLCGNVQVQNGCWIGAGATIIPGITIGENAVIGAGAVVIRDVAAGSTVVGNPARVLKP